MKFNYVDSSKSAPKQYLTLGDGKSATGVFRGEPVVFYQKFVDGKYQIAEENDPESKFAFQINFIIKEDDQLMSKIFQGNWFDYNQLKEINDEHGGLESTVIKISQTGVKQSKRISFMPMKQKPDEAKLAQVLLQELGRGQKKPALKAHDSFDNTPMPTEDDMPSFDDELPF